MLGKRFLISLLVAVAVIVLMVLGYLSGEPFSFAHSCMYLDTTIQDIQNIIIQVTQNIIISGTV